MCVRVRRRVRVRKREGEEGHVPLVARDQPNGFRLTPHVARKPVHPFSLVTLAEPPAPLLQNIRQWKLLFHWLVDLAPSCLPPFFQSESSAYNQYSSLNWLQILRHFT